MSTKQPEAKPNAAEVKETSTEAEAHKRSTNMSPAVSTKTAKTKEAKDFSKSEAELVDVMDTFQYVISIIEKEIAKNPTFLQKESAQGTRTTPR